MNNHHGHASTHTQSHVHHHAPMHTPGHAHVHHHAPRYTPSHAHVHRHASTRYAPIGGYIGTGPYPRTHYRASRGLGPIAVGLIMGLPLLVVLGLVGFFTTPMIYTAAAATSATVFSAATFGIGALILYGVIGLAYLYSGAQECYKTDNSILGLLKERIVNKDGLSFKGITSSIGAILWTPFLVLGGLAGMTVKAVVNAFSNSKKDAGQPDNKQDKDIPHEGSTSYYAAASKLGVTPSAPIDTDDVAAIPPVSAGRSSRLFDTQPSVDAKPTQDANPVLVSPTGTFTG